ncbi:glycosyl transferase [Wohlfahrtiimonas chitiniclastica]|uniref:glycosyltransferase n=1 Tax=Wohlfahrtiimonas chitiniclastica TaxID=400946 RepID=UPI000B98B0A1|nr:glycosyltransferase [Wohlfahrtiimonas chitiniclastica]OYQ70469.1 glycosyl transferase [Wohlfahrtiimonas chitiniclastica]
MKVLYLITGLGLGGAEKVVVELADQMVKRGHTVCIAYLKGNIVVKPKSESVQMISLGLESPKKLLKALYNFRQLIRQFKPDVVHAHMVHANIFARLARLMCKIPKLICTAHSSNEGGKARMIAYRYTDGLSDLNTNVSQEALDIYIAKKAFNIHKSLVVYNGIDVTHFSPSFPLKDEFRQEKIQFLSVGRLVDAKDYPNLLYAIAQVIQRNQNVHFSITGDGELRPTIEALIEQLGIGQYVTLLGRRDDVPDLMRQADCFILSSKYEGFGLVVAEAMACGTFVIATDCGGVKEVMGGYGYLVPPSSADALESKIIEFLHLSEDEQTHNNECAMTYVHEKFNLHNIAQQWEYLYQNH